MYRYDIINALIDKFNLQSYLEIGLDMCQTFLKVNCKYKECVDPYEDQDSEFTDAHSMEYNRTVKDFIRENILTYKMTSDEFFATIPSNKKYDIIFIDGLHEEAQVGRDIVNSLKHLNEGGYVVVHDCIPENYEAQTEVRTTQFWNGTTWRAIPMLKFLGIDFRTVETDDGCCVIQYCKHYDKLEYPQPSDYTYYAVFQNKTIRNLCLNVISIDEFVRLLETD